MFTYGAIAFAFFELQRREKNDGCLRCHQLDSFGHRIERFVHGIDHCVDDFPTIRWH